MSAVAGRRDDARYVLITQCLQNDFFLNEGRRVRKLVRALSTTREVVRARKPCGVPKLASCLQFDDFSQRELSLAPHRAATPVELVHACSYSSWRRIQSWNPSPSSRPLGVRSRIR